MVSFAAPHTRSVTHDVTNQPPPLAPYDAAADRALIEGLRREGAGWAEDDLIRAGPPRRQRRGAGLGRRGQPQRARAAHPRPVRQPGRRGRLPPELPQADGCRGRRGRLPGRPGRDGRAGAHVARAAGSHVWGHTDAGHGCPVSMTYAVVPALRHQPDLAAQYEPLLTSRIYDPGLRVPTDQAGSARRHGHDREAGRLGRSHQHHRGDARPPSQACSRLRGHKWFTLRADVRRVPGAGAGARRTVVLPGPAHPARRHAQHLPHPAAQGQARQPLERLVRARSSTARWPGSSAPRAAASDHHRDGQLHAAGLRASARRP